jgi:ABC-2 type transport system ATP-binding protein
MLLVENLVKSFKGFRAVDGVSFRVEAGENRRAFGSQRRRQDDHPALYHGHPQARRGRIRIGDYDLATHEQHAKRLLAFIPELPNPYELLTVREHMRLVAMCYDTLHLYEQRADELLQRYDLADKANALAGTLSKGMKQKLAVVWRAGARREGLPVRRAADGHRPARAIYLQGGAATPARRRDAPSWSARTSWTPPNACATA